MIRISLGRAAMLLGAIAVGTHAIAADSSLLTSRPLPKAAAVKSLEVGGEITIDQGEPQHVLLPDGSHLYVNQQTRVMLLADNVLSLKRGEIVLEVDSGWIGERPNTLVRSLRQPWTIRTAQREIIAKVDKELGPLFGVRVEEKGTAVLVTRGYAEVKGLKQPIRAGQQLDGDKNAPTAAPRVSHRLAWTRDLMSADAALIPPSEYAGGSLVAVDPDGQEAKLPLRRFHVDVYVEDGFARTTIDQTYFNQTNGRLEGTFYFPLPPDASLSQLTMYVNGERIDGGMVERDYGRTVYESIVSKQRDPALLEWIDGSTFKMRVFPLEPRQEKRILLSYTQKLPSLYGQAQYRFPSGGAVTVSDWSFQARIKHGTELAWNCPSHTLQAGEEQGDVILKGAEKNTKALRDVVLTLTAKDAAQNGEPRFSTVEQDGAKYLMLRYRPDLPSQKERERRDWIVLVESSADRDPLLMRTQIEIVRGLLAAAEPDDRLTVLAVNNRTYVSNWQEWRVTPERIASVLAFLEDTHLIGALDLGQGLAKAEPYMERAENPYLIHVGSGSAAMGERGPALLKRIPNKVRYVGIGVGHRWDRSFMKSAADKTGGYFTQINPDEPIAWRAFELAATLNTPRLLDVSVRAGADGLAWLTTANSLAQGEELCAVARFSNAEKLPESVTVRGLLNGKPFVQNIPVKGVAPNAAYLPRTWAKLEIEQLLADDPLKHKAAIIALSKAMVVMTPFTSLLVLENEEMYQQYKVERSRKDQWALYACPAKIPVVYEPDDGQPGDPKKGIKPSAKVVATTIATRTTPQLIELRPKPIRGQDWMGEPAPALPATPPNDFGLPSGSTPSLRVPSVPVEFWSREEMILAIRRHGNNQTFYKSDGLIEYPVTGGAGGSKATQLRYQLPPTHTINATGFTQEAVTYGPPELARILYLDKPKSRSSDPKSNDSTFYRRPRYSGDANFFADLVAFAPGLNTTTADLLAVLEAEASLKNNKPGTIDDAARALFDKARLTGAHTLTLAADGLQPAYTIVFDDRSGFQYERTFPSGLREQVHCDGKTLLHLYPDLGLAARRTVGRFHRLDFARFVPQALPLPEDYARGADLRFVGERTVAVVPHGAEESRDAENKPIPYVRVLLVFSAKGPLAERRYVKMPSKKVVAVEQFDADGSVTYLDANGKQTSVRKSELDSTKPQPFNPDLKRFIVLSLPYRTPDHVVKTLGIEKKRFGDLRFEEGYALLAAFFASGDAANAAKVFQECFQQRDQRQLGFYVLLAACGNNLDGDHFDLLTEHPNEPLAQYLALHSSPVLRKHATQWAVASNPWGDGWLNRLATAHALIQRWEGGRQPNRTEAHQQAERERALEFVKRNKGSALAWALLGLVQDRVDRDDDGQKDQRAAWKTLAEAWSWFADMPALAYYARYENARCLWKAGQADEARKKFRTLYEETFAAKTLPPIDADFRQALLGDNQANEWKDLMRRTAKQLLERKERAAVLALAQQCWHVEDQVLATDLLDDMLGNVQDSKEYWPLMQAVLELLIRSGQWEQADRKVEALLRDQTLAKQPALHRLAMRMAAQRDQPARQMRHLEQALDLEFRNRPDEIDLRQIRSEYGELLRHYQSLAEAMDALPGSFDVRDFTMRVLRTADRWRALDPQATEPCELAGRILRMRNERDLAWDYLTTPLALRPQEAQPWHALAATLAKQGDLELADRAYQAAFDAEPTDAQILWDRTQNLRQLGKTQDVQKLLRKLADDKWQPRFSWIQQQAKWQLEKR